MTLLRRSFCLGRTAGDVVMREREATVALLADRGLYTAAHATKNSASYADFFRMRGFLLAGGLRLVRTRGGRGIDR
jgi:hypothetical protein